MSDTKKTIFSDGSHTFALIKPLTVGRGQALEILNRLTNFGFQIQKIALAPRCPTTMEALYATHKGQPYYGELVKAMSVNSVVPMILYHPTKEAIPYLRECLGATKSYLAASGTIRAEFGGHVWRGETAPINDNAMHASDSADAAAYEAALFFQL